MCVLAIELYPQAQNVECTDEALIVDLIDDRTISSPLIWLPKPKLAKSVTRRPLLTMKSIKNMKKKHLKLHDLHVLHGEFLWFPPLFGNK